MKDEEQGINSRILLNGKAAKDAPTTWAPATYM